MCGRRWYPPGHGDIYTALKRCGLLEKFMQEGKEILFISNIDNLGATVDTSEPIIIIPRYNGCGHDIMGVGVT